MKNKSILVSVILIICFTVAGFIVGRLTVAIPENKPESNTQANDDLIEKRGGGYKFINPLWECDNYNPSKLISLIQLKGNLNNYIKEVMDLKHATHVSVYFRDLNNGPWLGINEKANFSPASLLKVPILIAALKKCETEPALLRKKIAFMQYREDNVSPNIVDTALIRIGNSYALEDLMYRMIAYSDNQAKELLVEFIGNDLFTQTMADIGINVNGVSANDDFVSVKDYSSFFRLLYNATYLNRDMSEKALEILSKVNFNSGLVAGLPNEYTVAHKFGERAFLDSDLKQLHDCGIIYIPGSPYLLCVMTRGKDFEMQASIIAAISKIVYLDISKRLKK